MSPEPRSGHRTYIGSVIFKEFKITLSNDIVVMVSRKEVIDGRYSISCLKKTGESILNWEWCPKESPDYIEDEESYDKYCQLMDTLALNIHYLPANRNTDINDQEIERELRARHMGDPRIIERISRQFRNRESEVSLEAIIENFKQWTRKQIILLTNNGYRNISDFYSDVIKALVSPKKKTEIILSKKEMIEKIKLLENRNNEFKKFGLSDEILNKDILKILRATTESKIKSINTIIIPYIKSMELRLKSLERLQILLGKMESYLNQFLTDKFAVITIGNGVQIFTRQKKLLSINCLSSGERQILLLLCSVIIAESFSNIVIIDEPEISLNVKWQRIFIKSLLDLVNNEYCQLIIATHSIEMITKHKESVSLLRSNDEN